MFEGVERKIASPETICSVAQELRQAGRTIVQCHGCFDIVHPGHVRYLQFARQLGDILVVSLTGDDAIEKGVGRPYIPQELRAENLAALQFVDWVVIDPRPTAEALLEGLRPDVYVKGREYERATDPRFVRERQIVERHGGRVVFHSGDVVFSSTQLLENMAGDRELDEHRLRVWCERNEINAASAAELIERATTRRVLVAGDVFRRRYVFCDADRSSPDAPVLALHQLGEREYWGGAAALAWQLRVLGARPTLVAVLGQDEASRAYGAKLASEFGDDCILLHERPGMIEQRTFVADDTKVFELSDGDSAPLDSRAERRVSAAMNERLADTEMVVWSDHGYGALTPRLVSGVGQAARARGLFVAGHAPGVRSQLDALRGCDLVTVSERRLREALHDMRSGLPAVVWQLLNDLQVRGALVSLRKRGVMGFDSQSAAVASETPQRLKSEFVGSFALHFADWSGADEALLAIGCLVQRAGGSLAMATYLAAAAQSLAAMRPGGEAVRRAEFLRWVSSRPELRSGSRFFPDAATFGDIARLAPPLSTEITA